MASCPSTVRRPSPTLRRSCLPPPSVANVVWARHFAFGSGVCTRTAFCDDQPRVWAHEGRSDTTGDTAKPGTRCPGRDRPIEPPARASTSWSRLFSPTHPRPPFVTRSIIGACDTAVDADALDARDPAVIATYLDVAPAASFSKFISK